MIRKQGVTLSILAITVIILSILASAIVVSINSTTNYTKLSLWVNEISMIQDIVDEELNLSSAEDYILDTAIINVTNVSNIEQFSGEVISQDNTISLKVLDLGRLNITDTVYGNQETKEDVYAISEKTGKVYYVYGIEIGGSIYYGLTENLKQRYSLSSSTTNLSTTIFAPSVIGYTNEPIQVTVKVPSTYTNVSVTTSNAEIQVVSQQTQDNVYLVNANNIIGNYIVTVSYNDGEKTLMSKYEVNGYDVTLPTIGELTEANFVYKETDTQIIDYLTNISATDESGIKIMKYALGTITEENAATYFKNNGNVIVDGKINLDRESTVYTIYAEDNAENYAVLTFDKEDFMPSATNVPREWRPYVVNVTEDGVPIPKGFIASQATGENTKDGGLVIYEGTEPVTDENVFDAKRNRNQYVWVPVDDFSKFIRQNFATSPALSATLGSDYWEVEVDENNMPKEKTLLSDYIADNDLDYITETTIAEAQAMYASVKKYKGFYIARYEAGLDLGSQRKINDGVIIKSIHSKMNKVPYNWVRWTYNNKMTEDTNGAVEVARSIYTKTNVNYGVVSTLTYGVQWDRTLAWWIEVKAKNGTGDVTIINNSQINNSTNYGNYNNNQILLDTFNTGAKYSIESDGIKYGEIYNDVKTEKPQNTAWMLTTGATEEARVNNIYDMCGNLWEITMEGNKLPYRVYRGGKFASNGNAHSSKYRAYINPSSANYDFTFRVSLYIK